MSVDSIRAFVVEDHAFQRIGMMAMLRSLGLRDIREAANGREALLALDDGREQPSTDVLLCDLEMPEMDGVEFLRAVADRHLARGVVIVSGREAEILHGAEAMARASGLEVLGRLRKPATTEALRRVLARVPGMAKPAARAVAAAPISDAALLHALSAGEFCAEFQPKVSLATGTLRGVEVLARWRPTDAPPVSPGVFVPALVRAGLITALTERMLEAGCQALAAWSVHGLAPDIAINLSMATLSDLKAADRFAARVHAHGVAPERVTFEVTETELMSDIASALNVLTRLRLKGFRLAIDDFGTGYSSLAQLNSMPFTELKIDQSFVRNCDGSERLRNIIQSSIELARRLKIRTVAEGIETEKEWDFLTLANCDEGQGYYVGKPMPAGEVPYWAGRWRAPATSAD